MAPYHHGTTPNDFLLSLNSVRERCYKVQEAATRNRLKHFDVDPSKLDEMVQFVISIIKRDYDTPSDIPVYGRWRHFDIGGRPRLNNLIQNWTSLGQDALEQTRKLIDLLVIACLMDMKPCQTWTYTERSTGRVFKRKDGIAIAILDLFVAGFFSSDPTQPHRVDSDALSRMTLESLSNGLQFTETNSFAGVKERHEVLSHLGFVLQNRKDYFGRDIQRPGNLMDYLLNHPTTIKTKKGPLISIETLWPAVQEMGEIWASEENLGGTPGLGDVWPCAAISNDENTNLVSFHKLSQWIVFSIIEPMDKLLGATIEGTDLLTPLPDYCNGGFLIDFGFLTLKPADHERGIRNYHANSLLPYQPKVEVAPMFDMSDPVVTEWRALTVAYLDLIAERVRQSFRLSKKSLSLSQLIQGGTWSAGRELAEISRPNTHEPPIVIKLDKRVIY
ncbi:Uracil catabolism protein 4 [Choanephora cucurbitarum]|uniref:Uracil catabolism protein 4 n=1 Tax=Choanephora cucurbitarum TaxID=101091 RepID=A0A1C7NPR1_9FUNG|nr:Uracil catabolism protein 4 [Choanephora cucurbitarum]